MRKDNVMGRKPSIKPSKKDRYNRGRSIKKQLEGKDDNCKVQGHRPIAQTNSKGKTFIECDRCGAFLGWR